MSEVKPRRGRGGKQNPGRPRVIAPDRPEDPVRQRSVRMTDSLWQWAVSQGGAEYVRRLVEEDRIRRLVV